MTEIELRNIGQIVARQIDGIRPRWNRSEPEFNPSHKSITLWANGWVVFVDCTLEGTDEKCRFAVCRSERSPEELAEGGNALHPADTVYFLRTAGGQWRDGNGRSTTTEAMCSRAVSVLLERAAVGEDVGVSYYGDTSGDD